MTRRKDDITRELGVTVFAVGAPTREQLLEKVKHDERLSDIAFRAFGDRQQYFCTVRGTRWRESSIPA